jgi:hypothetical protein
MPSPEDQTACPEKTVETVESRTLEHLCQQGKPGEEDKKCGKAR